MIVLVIVVPLVLLIASLIFAIALSETVFKEPHS